MMWQISVAAFRLAAVLFLTWQAASSGLGIYVLYINAGSGSGRVLCWMAGVVIAAIYAFLMWAATFNRGP